MKPKPAAALEPGDVLAGQSPAPTASLAADAIRMPAHTE
jgi:hypothetical protein